ncbi:hypothetical protein CDL62_14785 [Alkalitalea saponilacus]|nr:hypothetical protein CDL62_14785 [Alkalitalea saponilacus]
MKKNKGEIKYSSSYPLSIILGLILDSLIVTIFTYHYIFGELPILESVTFSLLSLLSVHLIICPNAGKVTLNQQQLTIKYFFIWNSNYEIETNKIISLETSSYNRYRVYSKIYITLNDNSNVTLNIQSWYSSILGVEILEKKFNEQNLNRRLINTSTQHHI